MHVKVQDCVFSSCQCELNATTAAVAPRIAGRPDASVASVTGIGRVAGTEQSDAANARIDTSAKIDMNANLKD